MAQMRETIPSMLRRLRGWDYQRRAIYQITLTLEDRASAALGRLEIKGAGQEWLPLAAAKGQNLSAHEISARVVPSVLGEAVAQCWASIPTFYPQIKVLASCIMPDHFHGILFVESPLACHLGQVIKGFKTGCNKKARELGFLCSPTLSANTGRNMSFGRGVFAAGFQDTVLLRMGQLANMRHYLADNPRRLAIKLLFPSLFKTVEELAVELCVGKDKVLQGRFSSLGNRFLLKRPLVQVQISRRDFSYLRRMKEGCCPKIVRDEEGGALVASESAAFAEKKAEYLTAAKYGSVLISPCVSDGEREIARIALAAGYPLVALHNKGFSRFQKPSGRLFDACALGKLLILAPMAWPHQPGVKPMTRADATALNRLCQWIAGAGAATINYRGLLPADIDSLALAAVGVKDLSRQR